MIIRRSRYSEDELNLRHYSKRVLVVFGLGALLLTLLYLLHDVADALLLLFAGIPRSLYLMECGSEPCITHQTLSNPRTCRKPFVGSRLSPCGTGPESARSIEPVARRRSGSSCRFAERARCRG